MNTAAGGANTDEGLGRVERLIREARPEAEVVLTDSGARAVREAQGAVEQGSPLVIAGGGDGTVSAVASALAGTGTVLGVMPLGTLNHFARDLGIPVDAEEAAHVLAAGRRVRVDVGEVNGRVFVNNSGLGLYPAMVRIREEKQERGASKRMAGIAAGLRALALYRLFSVHVSVGGRDLVRVTPIVFVGNNEYAVDGLSLGTRARLDTGELSLVIPHYISRTGLLWFTLCALVGRAPRNGRLDVIPARELVIWAGRRTMQVTVDGEVVGMAPPLSYRSRPGALEVMVPAGGR